MHHVPCGAGTLACSAETHLGVGETPLEMRLVAFSTSPFFAGRPHFSATRRFVRPRSHRPATMGLMKHPALPLEGKKIAVLVDTLYQEMEVWYPLFRFQEAGAEVVLVGAEAGKTYASKLGYPAVSQRSYDAVTAREFDGVVVPGGYAPDHIRRHPKAIQFVRDIYAQGKLVASICH